MNGVARMCTNMGRMTNTLTLMKEINCLTFKELVRYHYLVTLWRLLWEGVPRYFRDKITLDRENKTIVVPACLRLSGKAITRGQPTGGMI